MKVTVALLLVSCSAAAATYCAPTVSFFTGMSTCDKEVITKSYSMVNGTNTTKTTTTAYYEESFATPQGLCSEYNASIYFKVTCDTIKFYGSDSTCAPANLKASYLTSSATDCVGNSYLGFGVTISCLENKGQTDENQRNSVVLNIPISRTAQVVDQATNSYVQWWTNARTPVGTCNNVNYTTCAISPCSTVATVWKGCTGFTSPGTQIASGTCTTNQRLTTGYQYGSKISCTTTSTSETYTIQTWGGSMAKSGQWTGTFTANANNNNALSQNCTGSPTSTQTFTFNTTGNNTEAGVGKNVTLSFMKGAQPIFHLNGNNIFATCPSATATTCSDTYYVQSVMTLAGVTSATWTATAQMNFRTAIAGAVSGSSAEDVIVGDATFTTRRANSASVKYSLVVADANTATSAAATLAKVTPSQWKTKFSAAGLSMVTSVTVTTAPASGSSSMSNAGTTPTPSNPNNSTNNNTSSSSSSGLSAGAIVGIVIACLVCVGLVVGLGVFMSKRNNAEADRRGTETAMQPNLPSSADNHAGASTQV